MNPIIKTIKESGEELELDKIKEAIKILKPYSEIKLVEDKLLIIFKADEFLTEEFEKELDKLIKKELK